MEARYQVTGGPCSWKQRLLARNVVISPLRPCRLTPANSFTTAKAAGRDLSPSQAIAACFALTGRFLVRRYNRVRDAARFGFNAWKAFKRNLESLCRTLENAELKPLNGTPRGRVFMPAGIDRPKPFSQFRRKAGRVVSVDG